MKLNIKCDKIYEIWNTWTTGTSTCVPHGFTLSHEVYHILYTPQFHSAHCAAKLLALAALSFCFIFSIASFLFFSLLGPSQSHWFCLFLSGSSLPPCWRWGWVLVHPFPLRIGVGKKKAGTGFQGSNFFPTLPLHYDIYNTRILGGLVSGPRICKTLR